MNCDDKDRVEILSREAYDSMAREICHYDCIEFLRFIKNTIKEAQKADRFIFRMGNLQIGYYVFPFLIDLILKYGTTMGAMKTFNQNTLYWLLSKYEEFPCILQLPTGTRENEIYAPEALLRLALNQLHYQEPDNTLISRLITLFIKLPEQDPMKHYQFIQFLEKTLKHKFRVNLEDLIYCYAALISIGTEYEMMIDELTSQMNWMKPYVESDAIRLVRNHLEITRDEYRDIARKERDTRYEFIIYNRYILHDRPIIRFGDRSIVPLPRLIIQKLTRDIYNEFFDFLKSNGKGGDFANLYGNLIKDYIGFLLRNDCSGFDLVDLDQEFDNNARKADWLLFKDDTGIIIECTAPKCPDELKRSGSLELLSQYIDDNLIKKIEQCNDTQKHLSENSKLNSKYGRINSWFKLIIMEEQIYFYNDLVKFLPNNSTAQKLQEYNIQIMSLMEFETLVSSILKNDILTCIIGKYNNENRKISFESYFSDIEGFEIDNNSYLMKIYNQFFRRG